ncbi:hypothetical protein SLEP1_g36861 [Rubroshorea leprosula]|uniref:Uncharacterized protein n=1 Tax=Rubroshorea leprosula TaxID=152421 RepID=A0AAV5KTA1_9ROSI|nr:hypothetical protein SLEP1_g36861 [Rubroshorea leprosula]
MIVVVILEKNPVRLVTVSPISEVEVTVHEVLFTGNCSRALFTHGGSTINRDLND